MNITKAELKFTPEEAGYSSERLDFLDRFYSRLIENGELQGVMYGMARNGKVFAQRAMGKRRYDDVENDTLKPDSIRRIASITKLFTAVAVMKLVEDGEFLLNTCVASYLKEFEHDEFCKITIKHLLTHTSGLAADPGAYFEYYHMPRWQMFAQRNFPFESWIEAAIAGPLYSKPGTEWSYSSMGYALLGEIITRVTGVKCEDWIIDSIVKPLGMDDTYFDVPKEKWDRVVVLDDGWSDPFKWEENRTKRTEEMEKNNLREFDAPNTGGGIFSTVGDLLIFGQMLLNNGEYKGARILSRKSVELLSNDCGLNVNNYCWRAGGVRKYYGYGVDLYGFNREGLNSRSTYGHEGAGYCGLFIDPEESFVVSYFIPNKDGFHGVAIGHGGNIIWSGIL